MCILVALIFNIINDFQESSKIKSDIIVALSGFQNESIVEKKI